MTKEIYIQCKCGHEIEAADDCDNLKPGEFADGYESEVCSMCKRTGCWTVAEDTEAKPMTTHTPGEWSYNIHIDLPDNCCGSVNMSDGSIANVQVWRSGTQYPEETKANARLIAAAPELLEALEHAYRWHDQLSPTDVAILRAAIAKAKGE